MLKGISKVKTEVRREQITQSVFDIIAEKGVRSLTTSAIAQNIGISEANLYRHYKNKSDILASVIDRIGTGLLQNLARVQDSNDDFLSKLRKLFMLHIEFIQANRGIPRLVFSEEIHQNKELRGTLLAHIDDYTNGIAKLIASGQKSGVIRKGLDPNTTALLFIGNIQMITIKWSLMDFSFDLKESGRKLWKNLELCLSNKAGG